MKKIKGFFFSVNGVHLLSLLILQTSSESVAVLSPEDMPVFSSADIKLEMFSSNVSKFLSLFCRLVCCCIVSFLLDLPDDNKL